MSNSAATVAMIDSRREPPWGVAKKNDTWEVMVDDGEVVGYRCRRSGETARHFQKSKGGFVKKAR